jgi:hypothetical protein
MRQIRHVGTGASAVSVALVAGLLLSCGDPSAPNGGPTTPLDSTTRFGVLALTPSIMALVPGGQTSFGATINGNAAAVTWRVNGIAGGSALFGTISSNGFYKSPSTFPPGDTVSITAVLKADTSQQISAGVVFIPTLSPTGYTVTVPRVVDTARFSQVRVIVVPTSDVKSVTFELFSGPSLPFENLGNGAFAIEFTDDAARAGYVNETLHNTIAFVNYRSASGALLYSSNFGVNVRDATMPDVPITTLAADAQRAPYLLNLRVDTPLYGVTVPTTTVRRALQLLGDTFDYVAIVANVSSRNNRFFVAVRNDVAGIGLPPMDNSAAWGSAGRLRGLIHFPRDVYFDAGDDGMVHEIGHTFINYATAPILKTGVPHWPLSSLASGVMGFSLPGSRAGEDFPWVITPQPDGSYKIFSQAVTHTYTDWDLYLMGLVPASSVSPALILPSTLSASAITDGMATTATTYTIAEYIAAQGARVPSEATAPRDFNVAYVVLSYGGLLSPSEMAFFNANAARAESTIGLPSSVGFSGGTAVPFFLATGGRARLHARLQ